MSRKIEMQRTRVGKLGGRRRSGGVRVYVACDVSLLYNALMMRRARHLLARRLNNVVNHYRIHLGIADLELHTG
jgi:hypothetical protein